MAKRRKHLILRYLEYKILHIDDSPQKIALGLAIGLFVAWSPLLGLHILIALALTMLFRANKFVALTSVWVSNVFTFFIIYYPAYLVGRFVLNLYSPGRTLTPQQVSQMIHDLFSPGNILTGFYSADYWKHLWHLLGQIGPELWLGCILIGSLVALSSYLICYRIIMSHRAKSRHRRYRHY